VAVATPIGWVPPLGALDLDGLDISDDDMAKLLEVDRDEWRAEVPPVAEYYAVFGSRLPPVLVRQLDDLSRRLATA
jgi:phosphoenolpyruvate carboxykinase (GTP)